MRILHSQNIIVNIMLSLSLNTVKTTLFYMSKVLNLMIFDKGEDYFMYYF